MLSNRCAAKSKKAPKRKGSACVEPAHKEWKAQQRIRPPTNSQLLQVLVATEEKKVALAERVIDEKVKNELRPYKNNVDDEWMDFFHELIPQLQTFDTRKRTACKKAFRDLVAEIQTSE
ncbi:hypothetical protein QAD02_000503 [Eretmocerus hayati]|uniref:Uncharacterized protein n=1 Tax=Eretmocerus hayati TaxID=131215 RepID=A0ACC2NFX9_9HYME|nr:hypothetical protein QAD02_000503 [Eretmocerus hayati]